MILQCAQCREDIHFVHWLQSELKNNITPPTDGWYHTSTFVKECERVGIAHPFPDQSIHPNCARCGVRIKWHPETKNWIHETGAMKCPTGVTYALPIPMEVATTHTQFQR